MNIESMAQHGWVLAIQATFLLAVGLIAARLLHRKGAAWQIAIYRTTLVAAFALTLFGSALHTSTKPVWSVPTPASGPAWRMPAAPHAQSLQPIPATTPVPVVTDVVEPPAQTPSLSLRDLAIYLWGAGLALGLARILLGVSWLSWLRIGRRPEIDSRLHALLGELCAVVKVREPRVAPAKVGSPFLSGVLHPTIFLPEDYDLRYDDAQLRAILAHELTHIRHRDCLWAWLAKFACVVAWPHPLVWVLQRRLHVSAEELCDQAVLNSGLKPAEYANSLLRIAERTLPSRTERLVGVGVVPIRSTLGRRISLVLDTSRPTVTRVSSRGRAAISLLVFVVVAAVAVAIVPRSGKPGSQTNAQLEKGDPEATALMNQVRERYLKLKSLSADVRIEQPGQARNLNFVYKQPGWARVVSMERQEMQPALTIYATPDAYFLTTPHHRGEYLASNSPLTFSNWVYPGSFSAALGSAHQRLVVASMLQRDDSKLTSQQLEYMRSLPYRFGPDKTVEGVLCRTLEMHTKQPSGDESVNTIAVGKDDLLVRESIIQILRKGAETFREVESYSHVRADFDVEEATLAFHPDAGMKKVLAPDRSARSKVAPAVEEMEKVLRSANTLAYVVEEVSEQGGVGADGKVQKHTELNRLTVQVAKPGKAHIKLELKNYSHQNMEIWSDGAKQQIVVKGNTERYLEIPATKPFNPFGPVGIPGGACRVGLDMLQTRENRMSVGYFSGTQQEPVSLDGEQMDIVVQQNLMQDEYGFPQEGGATTTYYISQKDHMLRKTETRNVYTIAGKKVNASSAFTVREVQIDQPIPDETFAFQPAPGMTATEDLDELQPFYKTSREAVDQTLGIGQAALPFSSTLLTGQPVSLDQYAGKVLFLHGWTFGIGNYSEDLPRYEKLYRKFHDKGLEMVGIPYEEASERANVANWLKKQGITHPQIFDGLGSKAGIQHVYKMGGRPFVFIIDRKGIVYAKPSFDPHLDKVIQAALDRKN